MFKILFLFFLSMPMLSQAEEAKIAVSWDCIIQRSSDELLDAVSCIEIKLAYFNNPNLRETTADKADLKLIIRSLPLNNETEYQFTTRWMDQAPYSWPGLRLNSTLSQGEITEKIISFLGDINKPYLIIANNGSETPTEVEKDVPFYVAPTLNGSGSKQQGMTNLNGSGQVYGNYSNEKWRVLGLGYAGVRIDDVKTTPFNPGIKTKISYGGGMAGAVRDLGKVGPGRWDIAIFASTKTVTNDITIESEEVDFPEAALNNKARKTSISVGTEWIAVPFLTETSKGNISVRYLLGAENHNYISPETFEEMKETFAKHTLQVYLSRHFNKVDLTVGASAFSSTFRNLPLQGFSGSSAVTYKINPRMTLGANASMSYAKNRVMSPAEGSMSFLGLTSGSTPVTYNGSLSLTYTLGNIRIFNKEQRWKD